MKYERIVLFLGKTSRGTFDDIFEVQYDTMEKAWAANDYIHCDFVQDEDGILYIEAYHIQRPEIKKYHRLQIQRPLFGLDMIDDNVACEMAVSLFNNSPS